MGRARSTYGGEERCIVFWWADLRQGYHLEDPGADGRDNIKMDIGEVGCGCGLDQSVSGYGQVAGRCEFGDEHSGSLKCGEFRHKPRTC
jgi:hypothetical protein